jgi:hypothetical protein
LTTRLTRTVSVTNYLAHARAWRFVAGIGSIGQIAAGQPGDVINYGCRRGIEGAVAWVGGIYMRT